MTESLDLLSPSKINVFVPVLAHRFARERLRALAQAEGMLTKELPEVLFVCVHNAGRSQMAAGLVKPARRGAHSRSLGGERPRRVGQPRGDRGDGRGRRGHVRAVPEALTDEVVRAADVVITMGCGDACPIYPGTRYEDWTLDDPAGQDLETVRRSDEIDGRVQNLITSLLGYVARTALLCGGSRDLRARLRGLRR